MRRKRLLNVMLPATRRTYSFWVTNTMTLHEMSGLVSEMLGRRERKYFTPSQDHLFMRRDTGEILDLNSTVAETGLSDGTHLVLV